MTSENSDDDLVFDHEDNAESDTRSNQQHEWIIAVVDDDPIVHQATEFALARIPVLDRQLRFIHADSSSEAIELLRANPDVAVILLDVVMESEDAGLRLVKIIREDLAMVEARIILRTGQPGYDPEMDVIRDYDINDYKTKSELSRNRLYTTLTAAIRSYQQIHTINASRRGLDMIIRASGDLMARDGFGDFAAGIITQIAGLLSLPPEGVVCAHDNRNSQQTRVIAAAGHFAHCIDKPLSSLEKPDLAASLARALHERKSLYGKESTTLFFSSESGHDMVAYLETGNPLNEIDRHLLEIFCANISISFEKVVQFGQLQDYAFKDPQLGIPNQRSFLRELTNAMKDAAATSVALIAIDNVVTLNNTRGPTYGDQFVAAVHQRLASALPASTIIARVSADTFGLLGRSSDIGQATLSSLFAQSLKVAGENQQADSSIGVVALDDIGRIAMGSNPTDLLAQAIQSRYVWPQLFSSRPV